MTGHNRTETDMIYIGYIITNNQPVALTYGNEVDMLAWKELNLLVNSTTDLFLLPDGESADACLTDAVYFKSLF